MLNILANIRLAVTSSLGEGLMGGAVCFHDSNFNKALSSSRPLPKVWALCSSAKNSREREIAIWIIMAALGASNAAAIAAIGLPPPSSSRPPNIKAN